jgi:glycosyltransferase involved in cell wall biosynthesis
VADAAGPSSGLKLAFLGDPNSVHFRSWVNFMAARGNQVTVLLAEGKTLEPGLHEAISIVRFRPFYGHRFPPLGVLSARRSLRRVVARVRPDVLNAHYLTVNGYHAWISGFHPYVTTLWGSDILVSPRKSRLMAVLARLTLRAADMVMVNSEALEEGALRLGAPAGRTEMVQWGVDLSRFAPGPDPAGLRKALGLKGRRVVFSPRSITPLYRQQVIVRALASLPADVSLVLTLQHSQPDELAAVQTLIAELGLADRVVIVPEIGREEMPDYYRLADVVVSVPASDSTSVAVLEALASQTQIVAADLPSMRQWLLELDPPAIVPIDDVEATATALRRALDRPAAERREIGRRGRAIVEEKADQARTLAHVEDLYHRLVDARRGPGTAP